MNLDQFIANEKRTTQYGNPAAAADQAAKDILIAINNRIDRICQNWLWDWLFAPVSISLSPEVTDYTLPAAIRKIVDIDAGRGSLSPITLKEYHRYRKAPAGGTVEGAPGWYFYIGRDATTGARKIRVGDIPATASTLVGFGKLKVARFVEADLGIAKSMLPLPAEGEGVLSVFVHADIYRLQGKDTLVFPQEHLAERRLGDWRGEETTEPADNVTSKLPGHLRCKMINRRHGYVV